MPVVVDSSGWIEYFTNGANAECFAPAIEQIDELIVPSIILTEVYRWTLRETSETQALSVIAVMKQGDVVSLDDHLAILAAETSQRYRLPLADGIIYTTAIRSGATLFTQDADMEGLPFVTYIRHPDRK